MNQKHDKTFPAKGWVQKLGWTCIGKSLPVRLGVFHITVVLLLSLGPRQFRHWYKLKKKKVLCGNADARM